MKPSKAEILSVLRYDAERGLLIWISTPENQRWRLGKAAGCSNLKGYCVVRLNRKLYYAHRLIWFLHNGNWPNEIDHIDRNTSNNRIENLRPASRSENGMNRGMPITNTSGYKGATFDNANKVWVAQIKKEKKKVFIGNFSSSQAAGHAYEAAAAYHFGKFAPRQSSSSR